jgi:flagellar hook-associated protein 1 FlgK
MLGLFGTLGLSTRSLQVQQQGIEVAGHNLANVNNPAYARQRVAITSATSIGTENGFIEGTGAEVANIQQIRNSILDAQVVNENSVTGSLEAQQQALQYAQSNLGQQIDRGAASAEGAAATPGLGQHAIGDAINDLFKSFQSVSTQPSSIAERDLLLKNAQTLAERFNATDKSLGELNDSLNNAVDADVSSANNLLKDIASLNQQIIKAEATSQGTANDLRDARQAKLEELGKLVNFDTAPGDSGAVNITIGGTLMVDTTVVRDQLETYDSGNGKLLVRAASTDAPLSITGGHVGGTIDARDGAIQTLRNDLSTLASTIISQVNSIHRSGYGLDDSTGLNLFEGTSASDMRLNAAVTPEKVAASDKPGEDGNNKVIVQLADLQKTQQAGLNNQTFTQRYSAIVGDLGTSLNKTNQGIADQTVVTNMVQSQRDSVSAVSMDEEMTDLVKFQRAYQASAQVVNVINEMLDTVINMMR